MDSKDHQSEIVVSQTLKKIMDGFENQIKGKKLMQRFPQVQEQRIRNFSNQMAFSYKRPFPKYFDPLLEDNNPERLLKNNDFTEQFKIIAKKGQRQSQISDLGRDKISTRQTKTSRNSTSQVKRARFNFFEMTYQKNQSIPLVESDKPQTSKSKKVSQAQTRENKRIDDQIDLMRKSYLKELLANRKQEYQEPQQRKKRINKNFTFDFNGKIINSSNPSNKKQLAKSSLILKSCGKQRYLKKNEKNPENSKRQTASHFLKNSMSKPKQQPQQKEDKMSISKIHDLSISEEKDFANNLKIIQLLRKSSPEIKEMEKKYNFNPINVPRDHNIDRYYKYNFLKFVK